MQRDRGVSERGRFQFNSKRSCRLKFEQLEKRELLTALLSDGIEADPPIGIDEPSDGGRPSHRLVFSEYQPIDGVVYEAREFDEIDSTESDLFSVELNRGQRFSVSIFGVGDFLPALTVSDPTGLIVGQAGDGLGHAITLNNLPIQSNGPHTISISGHHDSRGFYQIKALINGSFVGSESSPSNSSRETAINVQGYFADLPGDAEQATLVHDRTSTDAQWYRFDLADGQRARVRLLAAGFNEKQIQAFDSQGELIANNPSFPSEDISIDFIHEGTVGIPETYFLEVTGELDDGFTLVFYRDTVPEAEPNNHLFAAHDITRQKSVIGRIQSSKSEVFAIDDGSSEFASRIAGGGDILWMNGFEAPESGQTITTISVAWAAWTNDNRPATVLLYDDPDNDGHPANARLLAQNETFVTAQGSDRFIDVPIPPTKVEGHFFVAALYRDQDQTEIVAPVDGDTPSNSSWLFRNTTPQRLNEQQLTARGTSVTEINAGTYLLRAKAEPQESGDDWYTISAEKGHRLVLETSTPRFGSLYPTSGLDPMLELYDPHGNLLANDRSSHPDEINAIIEYAIEKSGTYRVRVTGESESTGSYVLNINADPRFDSKPEILRTTPTDGEYIQAVPDLFTIEFNEAALFTTITKEQLLINGHSVLSTNWTDARHVQFELPPELDQGDGEYRIWLQADAIEDFRGNGIEAYEASFFVDTTPPTVARSNLNRNALIKSQNLTVEVTFDEAIDESRLDKSVAQVRGNFFGRRTADRIEYDRNSSRLQITFTNLPDDTYEFHLSADRIFDLAGNNLDGEFVAAAHSGDGIPGGDYQIPFAVDQAIVQEMAPFKPKKPLGSLIYTTEGRSVLAGENDVDIFSLSLKENQLVSIRQADDSVALNLDLKNELGETIGDSQDSPGLIQSIRIPKTGDYLLHVSGRISFDSGLGKVEVFVGAQVEEEPLIGSDNGTVFTAESISLQELVLDIESGAVTGNLVDDNDEDWFRIPVQANDVLNIAMNAEDSDDVLLELLGRNARVVASGQFVGNADQMISDFEVADSGDLFIRVRGPRSDYALVVTKNLGFEREGNNRPRNAQDMPQTGVILGHLSQPIDRFSQMQSTAHHARKFNPKTNNATVPALISSSKFRDDRIIVKFVDSIDSADRTAILQEYGAIAERVMPISGTIVASFSRPKTDPMRIARQLSQRPEVEYAEPDYFLENIHQLPNDALFNRLFAFENTGQIGGRIDADIDAVDAWNITTGSRQVVVAVIDSGVDYNHPDLIDNIWVNPGEIANDGIDNDNNGYVDDIHGIDTVNHDSDPFADDVQHGTHVAGIIGAVGGNQLGITGVNWNVRLMPIQRFNSGSQSSNSTAVEALEYITMMKRDFGVNVVVSNNSYGSAGSSRAFREAIQGSIDAGILFVTSAGNDAVNIDVTPQYPASYDLDGIIAVAATDKNDLTDSVNEFTNYGKEAVDLAAPGVTILSTVPGGAYDFSTGTSMSAPMVAGAVALLKSVDPDMTVDELKGLLLSTVDPIDDLRDKTVSGGRLNVANAISLLQDDYYRFHAQAGQNLLIQTKTPDLSLGRSLDLAMQLFDPQGTIVGEDNDSGIGLHPRITHVAQSTGEYLVRIFGAEVNTFGEYLLELQTDDNIVGDFDANGKLTVDDIDFFNLAVRLGIATPEFDLNRDGQVTTEDRDTLIHDLIGTYYGDADLNGTFDTRDLVSIFQIDEYEDGKSQNSTWAEGEWDGDGEFSSRDLVLAFQDDAFNDE